MKKIAVGIAVVLGFTLLQPVSAQASNPSVVIIDNAIDSTLPEFSGKLILEVCPKQLPACKNGSEGPGVATLPSSVIYAKGTNGNHGTKMALSALQVNPNAQIIFIRVGTLARNGLLNPDIETTALSFALDWVVENRIKYNIVSVSASLATVPARVTSCPLTLSTNQKVVANTRILIANNVAVFYPTGNDSNRARVVFPACITEAVSVGAINAFSKDDGWKISPMTNRIAETDFYALGSFKGDGIIGQTSSATAALAAYWAKNYKGSFATTYQYLKSISSPTLKDFVNVLG